MVTIGLRIGGVFPIAVLVIFVVRAIVGVALPLLCMTHDGEMVVTLAHQVVGARLRRIDGLRQRDARGNSVELHLLHRKILVIVNVIINAIFHRILGESDGQQANSCH